jgi:hypothetical protein
MSNRSRKFNLFIFVSFVIPSLDVSQVMGMVKLLSSLAKLKFQCKNKYIKSAAIFVDVLSVPKLKESEKRIEGGPRIRDKLNKI